VHILGVMLMSEHDLVFFASQDITTIYNKNDWQSVRRYGFFGPFGNLMAVLSRRGHKSVLPLGSKSWPLLAVSGDRWASCGLIGMVLFLPALLVSVKVTLLVFCFACC